MAEHLGMTVKQALRAAIGGDEIRVDFFDTATGKSYELLHVVKDGRKFRTPAGETWTQVAIKKLAARHRTTATLVIPAGEKR